MSKYVESNDVPCETSSKLSINTFKESLPPLSSIVSGILLSLVCGFILSGIHRNNLLIYLFYIILFSSILGTAISYGIKRSEYGNKINLRILIVLCSFLLYFFSCGSFMYIKSECFVIRDVVIKNLENKISDDKLKILRHLIDERFSQRELNNRLKKESFTEEEINIVAKHAIKSHNIFLEDWPLEYRTVFFKYESEGWVNFGKVPSMHLMSHFVDYLSFIALYNFNISYSIIIVNFALWLSMFILSILYTWIFIILTCPHLSKSGSSHRKKTTWFQLFREKIHRRFE